MGDGLQFWIDDFEMVSGGSPLGQVGLYVKNVGTDQALGSAIDEPMYLASTAKIPIHIRFWQHIQSGHLDLLTTTPYTKGANRRDDWYVDERGGTWGLSSANFGQLISLERFDRAMMDVSDNGATTMLVDHPTLGLSFDSLDLNEWLAGLDGIGQGFFPITSIGEVDQTILWQAAVMAFPVEQSYFRIPQWAFEPHYRTGVDQWGDLRSWLHSNRPGWTSALPQRDPGPCALLQHGTQQLHTTRNDASPRRPLGRSLSR